MLQQQQHQQQTQSPIYQDANSNSLQRQQQPIQGRSRQYNTQLQHRGPFVTQVTIGEHTPHQNGTKV